MYLATVLERIGQVFGIKPEFSGLFHHRLDSAIQLRNILVIAFFRASKHFAHVVEFLEQRLRDHFHVLTVFAFKFFTAFLEEPCRHRLKLRFHGRKFRIEQCLTIIMHRAIHFMHQKRPHQCTKRKGNNRNSRNNQGSHIHLFTSLQIYK